MTLVFWHYAAPLIRSNHHRGLAAQRGLSDPNDPKQLLAEANRFAWLFNGPQAEPLYARAEALFAQVGDHRNELYAKIGRTRAEAETMSFVDISDYLSTELKTPLVQDDAELKLWCLTSKGYTDIEIDAASAKRDWEEAQVIAKSLGERQWEIRAKGELGLVAFLEGDSGKAARLVGGALLSTMTSGDVGGQVRYLELIGTGLNEIERREEAIPFFDRAINLAARTKDAGFPFMAYEGKAEALTALGKADEARSTLANALAQARVDHKRGHEAQLLILLGKLSEATDDKPQAIEYLEKAGALAGELKFYRMVSDAYFELAKIYREEGNIAKAEACLTTSLDASSRVGDRYYVPRNLTALAELKASEGQIAEATALYERAEDVIDGLLINSPGHYSKSSVASAMSETYREHFRLAAQTHDVRKAFAILERVRGRTAADALRNVPSSGVSESPAAAPIERNIATLQVSLMRSEIPEERKQLLENLEEEEQKLGLINDSSSRTYHSSFEKPADLVSVQRALRPDELVLEYVLEEPHSFCLGFSKTQAWISKLAGRKQIEDLTERYLARIKSMQPGSDLARQLYALLIAPLPVEASKLRLIVIPDGKLYLLPFESLKDLQGRYFLFSAVITYAPSATVLTALRTEPSRSMATRTFLGVGDIPYEPRGTLLAKVAGPSTISGRVLRGLYDLAGVHLEDLPHTREEVLSAQREIGTKISIVLLGQDATETAFKAEPLGEFKIIHLAAHSLSSTQYPERAALVLGRDPRSSDDGLLQVREIVRLHLNANLVTLSACDTGIGKLQGEEGVTNLVQAFFLAGAKAVVASLWAADDSDTTSLMEHFYRHLAQKEDKATALQHAKFDLVQKYADQAPPFYWAGFVMAGEGSTAIPVGNP
jgi:CHAT domain-containing protein/predicted negative regulator of RcsB-dependent stress response